MPQVESVVPMLAADAAVDDYVNYQNAVLRVTEILPMSPPDVSVPSVNLQTEWAGGIDWTSGSPAAVGTTGQPIMAPLNEVLFLLPNYTPPS